MKNLTACLFTMIISSSLVATTHTEIQLVEGDFVKGELTLLNNQQNSADLFIEFADHSQRQLLKNIFDKQEFMFKAETSGVGKFIVKGHIKPLTDTDVSLKILQHIPREQQNHLKDKYDNVLLQELVLALKQSPEQQGHLLEQFWETVKEQGTPLIEPLDQKMSRVTFLWRGAKHNVRIFGGPTTDHDLMQHIPNTDIWYRSYEVPNDTHVSYRLAPDVPILSLPSMEQRRAILSTAQADPFNHFPYFNEKDGNINNTDKYNYVSQLILPKAPKSQYEKMERYPQGKLATFEFESSTLGNKRRLFVYTPVGFQQNQSYPVLYLFDGVEFHTQVPLPTILDNMIAEKVIPPITVVFIENPSSQARASELPPNSIFANVLVQELVPFIEKSAHIQASNRIIAGASYGGLAAAYVALQHSNIFSNALIMSGSFWWHPKDTKGEDSHFIASEYIKQNKLPICFFMSAGYFESGRSEILQTSRHLKDVLLAKGYPITYREYSTAHGYLAWKNIITDGLVALLNNPKCFSTNNSLHK
ncbi:esterase family protein [Ursidibacter sp. B-7004-1]